MSLAKEWHPGRFVLEKTPSSNAKKPLVIIISNQPLDNKPLLLYACRQALTVTCADGGANRLMDLNLGPDEERDCRLSAICGDLDSVRPEVIEYYEGKGVMIVKDPDQYSTDLMKCLKHLEKSDKLRLFHETCSHNPEIDVAIFGALGGRADQAFSQLHHLYWMANYDHSGWKGDVFLITPDSLVFLLEKGSNKIYTPVGTQNFTENIGIIPIGRPSIIKTRGLEWDVADWHTEFGGQMSTSNHIKADVIEVETTERVLFTLEFA